MKEYKILSYQEIKDHPMLSLTEKSRYSSHKFVFRENVAEHTCNTTLLSIFLAQYFNKIEDKNIFNLEKIAYKGVIHDVGEGFTADVVTKIKHSSRKMSALIDKFELDEMKSSGDLSDSLINDIVNAKDDTLEGLILYISDRLDAVFKIDTEYAMQNNRRLNDLFFEVITNTKSCLINFIEHRRISRYKKIVKVITHIIKELDSKLHTEHLDYKDSKYKEKLIKLDI